MKQLNNHFLVLFLNLNNINLFKGKPIALVPEWSDIIDLKFEGNEKTLWIELIDILKYWCKLGVDGFRMDVASGVTMQFWLIILM